MTERWDTNKSKSPVEEKITVPLTSAAIERLFEQCDDFCIQRMTLGGKYPAAVMFIDGLCDTEMISEDIMRPLTQNSGLLQKMTEREIISFIEGGGVYHPQQSTLRKSSDVVSKLLRGFAALVLDNERTAVCFEVKDYSKRSIAESSTEATQKGGKDAFIEVIRSNTSLVRLKIASHKLKIRQFDVGDKSKTTLAVVYYEGTADETLVNNVIARINSIRAADIITAAQFEEQVTGSGSSPFPQAIMTERPDKFCANIIEGKVGVIIDGLPTTYILPGVFAMFMQAPEDYSENFIFGSLIRFLRYLCAIGGITLPAFYIALVNFHQEMIPTKLILSIIKAKQGVPFSAVIEVLLMLTALEVLIEAGKRLPQAIGQTISIVGGLIIGDAAVSAKLLSPAVVVIVAAAGLWQFVMPSQDLSNAFRLCRFALVVFAGFGGLFGITLGSIMILYYMCTLESFGMPYLSPFAGNHGRNVLRDTLFRRSDKRREAEHK